MRLSFLSIWLICLYCIYLLLLIPMNFLYLKYGVDLKNHYFGQLFLDPIFASFFFF